MTDPETQSETPADSHSVALPLKLLRLVVQAADTVNNRRVLAETRAELIAQGQFDGDVSAVKLEHVTVVTLDRLHDVHDTTPS